MPRNAHLGGVELSVLPISAFNPTKHEIVEDNGKRFKKRIPEGAVKSGIEAYVCSKMIIHEENKWNGAILAENICEDVLNASEDFFWCMNSHLPRKCRKYLRDCGVFVPEKENGQIFSELAEVVL